MIKVDPLLEILRITLASGYVEGEKPLSLVIVSDVESGKTEMIRKYCIKTNGIFYTTDATAFGIIRDSDYLRDFENKFKHIVIPDLLTCMARRETTVNTLIHFLNSLIEEGVVNISTYATKIKQTEKNVKKEVKVGLVTSVARKPFLDKRYRWSSIGFLSRVLPVSYSYSLPTRLEILDWIEKEEHLKERLEKIKFAKKPKEISLSYRYCKLLEPYALSISKAQDLYGFRLQRQFQTFLKSIAYLRKSKKVETKDFDKFKELIGFINLDFRSV